MDELLADELVRLKREVGAPRVSLFLPLSPGSGRSAKGRARARNAVLRTDRALRATGLMDRQGARVLGLVQQALDRPRPVAGRPRGLAVFADAERVRRYEVALPLPELAAAGDRFTVAPVLPALAGPGRFSVLTLSEQAVRVYRGTPLSLEPVESDGLEVAVWSTMPRAARLPAVSRDRRPSPLRPIFRGVDGEPDEQTARVLQHFRGVDRALRQSVQPNDVPLVLAGPEHLQSLYRAVSTHPHLLEHGVDGSPEQRDAEQLHRQARAVAESEWRRRRTAALDRYRQLRGTGRTANTVGEVRRAALAGRVDTVLVDERACTWAAVSAEEDLLRLDGVPSAGEETELAVLEAIRRSGGAYVVPGAEWRAASDVIAVLRPSSPEPAR